VSIAGARRVESLRSLSELTRAMIAAPGTGVAIVRKLTTVAAAFG
jgi:hypothetical protein